MAPTNRHRNRSGDITVYKRVKNFVSKFFTYDYVSKLLTDPKELPVVGVFLLVFELVLNVAIVEHVAYTEIDWKAYMQECEGFLNGTRDYYHLKGDTGPLVYPAGFVYVYSALYFLTSRGTNVKLAQYVFLAIYLSQTYLMLRIYAKTQKVPPYALIITTLTSYRVHSIYVLRLFNDTVAVLLLYFAVHLFLNSRWTVGSVFFSLAVSVKMNILLFAPALSFVYLANLGLAGTFRQLVVCAFVQVALGAPFLLKNPTAYVTRSFDVRRVFEHRWTVNYRFLDRSVFEDRLFHRTLLLLHLFLLAVFLFRMRKYFTGYAALKELESQIRPQIDEKNSEDRRARKRRKELDGTVAADERAFLESFETALRKSSGKTEDDREPYAINFDVTSRLLVLPLFVSNFIGVVCARSLHYQFYVWYFHTLPYLLFFAGFRKPLIFLILSLIELSWNTYPSTNVSCTILHACHLMILFGVYRKL